MAAPSSQKAVDRPIGFLLTNANNPAENRRLRLNLRPEDLRRSEPSLQTPISTFGGAWLDDWGPGLQQISISGHTGWRGGEKADGGELFKQLRQTVWTEWHRQRAEAVSQGVSPNTVKLIFVDKLDSIVAVVAPGNFSLNRSRSRPLLYQYNLTMTVLADDLDLASIDPLGLNPDGSSHNPDGVTQGLVSVNNAASSLLASAKSALAILPPAHAAIATLMGTVSSVVSVVGALSKGNISLPAAAILAGQISQASRNVILSYITLQGLTGLNALPFAQAASAMETASCVFANVFARLGSLAYTNYSSLDGTSSCATTLGVGQVSPYLGLNPWPLVAQQPSPVVQVTAAGQNAVNAALQFDPVFPGVLTLPTVVSTAAALNIGVITT